MRKNGIYLTVILLKSESTQMYKLTFLLFLIWGFLQCVGNVQPREYMDIQMPPSVFPENITTLSCMTIEEARITNGRYINKDVIWSRPKGLLYGNFVGSGSAQKANLYPDLSTTYFVSNIHWEGNLTLTGRFPNARYFSFTVANQLGSGQLGNGEYIRGDQIIPDPGSSNPFIPSPGGRSVTARNYTLRVLLGDPPEHNVPNNTLYTGTLTNEKRVHLSIRTYLVDTSCDGTGNIGLETLSGSEGGLPKVTLNLPGGNIISGSILLKILDARKEGDPNGYDLDQWLSNIENSNDKINAPCLPIPASQVFWNTDYSVTGSFEADHPEKRVRNYPPNNDGGFANNPDTKYMTTQFSFGFGEVLVVRGKMPTHPKTRRGEDTLPKDPQVQYFSASTAASPPSGEGWDTVCDEQIPLDADGIYTIIVSWPWNRPSNAILENGVIWLSPGGGEGYYVGARNWVGVLYFRFQNPSPNWKQSPANIPLPTIEEPIPQDLIVMGSYYPRGEYMSKTDFEKLY